MAAALQHRLDCPPSTPPPLVTLLVLTCNRPAFLRLALDAAARQTYANLEVIVVDDSPRTGLRYRARRYRFALRVVRLSTPTSIGGKRNAGLRIARGAVVLHWDDDDMHHPSQVATLACPILSNATEITALTFGTLALLDGGGGVRFFEYAPNRTRRSSSGPFLGSLAYARGVASSLTLGGAGTIAPFAHVSLSEDLDFVERALARCWRMLPISQPHVVYTRHAAAGMNTWRPTDIDARMQHESPPPAFVDAAARAAYAAAEAHSLRLGACRPKHRHEPPTIVRPVRFPYNPPRCCRRDAAAATGSSAVGGGGGRLSALRRPCTDAVAGGRGCDADETFCGARKGTCTATCHCKGEPLPPSRGAPPTTRCSEHCCSYWHRFWRKHAADQCDASGQRPLKRLYCAGRVDGQP